MLVPQTASRISCSKASALKWQSSGWLRVTATTSCGFCESAFTGPGCKSGEGGDSEADGDPDEDYEAKKRRVLEETKDIDADSASSSSSEESDDDDEEDETAELMRELAKIKAERAEAAAKVAAEQAAKEEEQREKDIALGNPLLSPQKDYGIKRRWDDDVVFKNQARGTEEKGKEKRFVNDLLRSDFHRRFMDKYVR